MKKRYIFLSIVMCATFMHAPAYKNEKSVEFDSTKQLSPGAVIAATLYRTITPSMIKNGLIINNPGSYVLVTSTTVPDGAASTQETSSINGTDDVSNGVISIRSSNVTLNMNGTSLKTAKASIVGIYIDKDLSNVTIENGSFLGTTGPTVNWDNAIVIGQGSSNIKLRDLNISGCVHADGAINFKGDTGASNTINNVTLENVEVLNQTNTSSGKTISLNYVNRANLNNVRSNNANCSAQLYAVEFDNCNNINATNLQANHNITTSGLLEAVRANSCSDITINDSSASNNTAASNFYGIRGITSNNVTITNSSFDTNTGTYHYGVRMETSSQNVILKDISICKNTASSDTCDGLHLFSVNNAKVTNLKINNNVGTSQMTVCYMNSVNDAELVNIDLSNNESTTNNNCNGLLVRTCNDIRFDHIEANNITNADHIFLFDNIYGLSSSNISIINSSICNCTSGSGSSYGFSAEIAIDNLTMKNCLIANNSATAQFRGFSATAVITNLTLENVDILNNTSSAGDMEGIYLAGTVGAKIHNCNASHNTASDNTPTRDCRGLYATSSTENLTISNSNFSFNSVNSSNVETGGAVAGVWIDSIDGATLTNCAASNNTGSGRAYGFYLTTSDNARLTNCAANRNAATATGTINVGNTDTKGIDALPSAGFYLLNCDHCRLEDCTAKSNLAGNSAPGATSDVIELATSCSGFGFMNIGTSNTARNLGNVFERCTAHGNGTQLDTAITVGGGTYVTLGGALGNRYALSEAVAGGFADQWGQGTEFNNCTANNNGLQNNLISYGFLTVNSTSNKSTNINVNACSASNNWFFGFCDDGVQQGTRINNETTFTGCYAAMNGQQNSNATSQDFIPAGGVASEADGHIRNYYMYFDDLGLYSPIKEVSYGNQDFSQIPGNQFFNVSLTFEA